MAGVTKKTDRMVGCAPKGLACTQSLLTECLHNQITEDYGKCLLINGSKLRNNKPNGLVTFYSALTQLHKHLRMSLKIVDAWESIHHA